VLKDVPSVLALVKEETVRPLLHLDVEEVVERVDALNDKLLLESCSGTLEKLWARGGEDNVINIEQQISKVGDTAVDEQ
jgi:hypothetical protein